MIAADQTTESEKLGKEMDSQGNSCRTRGAYDLCIARPPALEAENRLV